MHDPDSHANPLEFDPERFLGDHPEPDPRATIFGYGRRICECFCFVIIPSVSARKGFYPVLLPLQTTEAANTLCPPVIFFLFPGPGINLALPSLWLACAIPLAVLDIEKYIDEFGNVVEPKIHYSDGVVRYVFWDVGRVENFLVGSFLYIAATLPVQLYPAVR